MLKNKKDAAIFVFISKNAQNTEKEQIRTIILLWNFISLASTKIFSQKSMGALCFFIPFGLASPKMPLELKFELIWAVLPIFSQVLGPYMGDMG